MSNTTRWKDTQDDGLGVLINKIMSKNGADESSEGDPTRTKYKNVFVEKKFETNREITLNGRNINFNYIVFSCDKVSADSESNPQAEEDRTVKNEGFILIYNDGIKNSYIINKNSEAMSLLRYLLGYTGRGEISKNNIELSSDFIVWLISRVYLEENVINVVTTSTSETDDSDDEENLEVESFIGFKGSTEDLLSTVTADGDSVMNILSTLSFILESKSLKQVKIRINYPEHENIEMKIGTNGTVDIDLSKYDGIYEGSENYVVQSKLLLLVYIAILPVLKQWYIDDKESGEWSKGKHIEFLNDVANDLKGKVDSKIKLLEGAE